MFSADEIQAQVEQSDGSDDGDQIEPRGGSSEHKMENLQRKLGKLLDPSEKAEAAAKDALERTVDSKVARQHVELMRTSEVENGRRASEEGEKESVAAVAASKATRTVVEQAEEASR